jgi:hypothetical protein
LTVCVKFVVASRENFSKAALVSTVPLNNTARGGSGDAVRTTVICDLLRNDRDDMVVKALSWTCVSWRRRNRIV